MAPALLAACLLNAFGSAERISVSVTPGGSARVLTIGPDGTPSLFDNGVGERSWKKTPTPSQTHVPLTASVLGLPNAEVRAYATGGDGVVEYYVSRTPDAWSRSVIDDRGSQGPPCVLRSARYSWLFARSSGAGLIALREQGGSWKRLSAAESLFPDGDVASIACSTLGPTSDEVAITLSKAAGGMLVAVLNGDGEVESAAELMGETDALAVLSGGGAIAGNDARLDVFGISSYGELLHWRKERAAADWQLERVSAEGGSPTLDGSPSAVWHEGRLFLAARTTDQKTAVFAKSADDESWSVRILAAPGGEPVVSDPHLASQPEELSVLGALRSGNVVTLKYADDAWTAGLLTEGEDISAAVVSSPEHAGQVRYNGGADLGGSKGMAVASSAAATQTLQQYIDSIPVLIPPPAVPPRVVDTVRTYTTENGIRFENLTHTTARSTNLTEAVAFNPNIDVLWAGAVIQGKTISTGLLAGMGLPRAPLTITLRDVGGYGPLSRTIASPNLATATTAVRDLLKDLGPVKATAAIDFDSQSGQTVEDALLKVGVSVDFLGQKVKSSVQSTSNRKSSTVVVKLLQRYYTIAVDTPASPAAMFAPTVTAEDAKRFMGAGNPPLYISQVSYGRMLFYVFESSESLEKLEAAVDAVFRIAKFGGELKLNVEQQRIFNNTRTRMFALGGLAEDAIQVINGDFTPSLKKYLNDGANFSVESPGAPLAYTVKWLKDGTVAQMNVATRWYTTATYALPEEGSFFIGLGNTKQRDCKDWPNEKREIKPYPIGAVQTGFYVRPGDRFSITAMGQVWSGVFATGFNPPNGWYTWKTPKKGIGFPNEEVPPFSLLFRIGEMNPPPFVGYGFPSREYQGSTGELQLLINTNNVNNGSGCFKVLVKVERRQN